MKCPKCSSDMEMKAAAGGWTPDDYTDGVPDHWWCSACGEVVEFSEAEIDAADDKHLDAVWRDEQRF